MTGKQLRMLRQRAGITQQQLADRWKLRRETVSAYENSKVVPGWVNDAILSVVREVSNG